MSTRTIPELNKKPIFCLRQKKQRVFEQTVFEKKPESSHVDHLSRTNMSSNQNAQTAYNQMGSRIVAMHADMNVTKEWKTKRSEEYMSKVKKFVNDPGQQKSTVKVWLRKRDEASVHAGDANDYMASIQSISNVQTTAGVKHFAEQEFYKTASTNTSINVLTAGLVCAFSEPHLIKDLAQDIMAQYSDDQLNTMQIQNGFESRAQVASLLVNQFADMYTQQSNLASDLLKARARCLAALTQAQGYETLFQLAQDNSPVDPFQIAAGSSKYAIGSPDLMSLNAATTTNTTTTTVNAVQFEDTDEEDADAEDAEDTDEEEIDADGN